MSAIKLILLITAFVLGVIYSSAVVQIVKDTVIQIESEVK